jgi:adenylate cyclase
LRAHNAIVRDALRRFAGREIKHTGDGIMAAFTVVSNALSSAVEIQQAISAYSDDHPELPFRAYIGLNAGEPIAEDQDLYGTCVDLAARICAHARSGQVLVSDVVRQLAEGKGFVFVDQGEAVLRGFEQPCRLYEVQWGT